MSERKEYPDIDLNRLEKGSVVTDAEIATAYGVAPDSPILWRKKLEIRSLLERHFWGAGLMVTIAEKRGQITVLTDADAAEYARRGFDSALRTMAKRHQQGAGVDRVVLEREAGPDAIAAHDSAQYRQGRILQAVQRERKMINATPVEKPSLGLSAKDEG